MKFYNWIKLVSPEPGCQQTEQPWTKLMLQSQSVGSKKSSQLNHLGDAIAMLKIHKDLTSYKRNISLLSYKRNIYRREYMF